jgi:hypothetical protein
LTTAQDCHLPNSVTSPVLLMGLQGLEGQGKEWELLPVVQRRVMHWHSNTQTTQSCRMVHSPPKPQAEAGDVEQEGCQGSDPPSLKGPQVHFCLCHLPAHLMSSHDGLIRFLNSFQLSLITLQICKSSQAGADREGEMPSVTLSLGLLLHLWHMPQRQPPNQ